VEWEDWRSEYHSATTEIISDSEDDLFFLDGQYVTNSQSKGLIITFFPKLSEFKRNVMQQLGGKRYNSHFTPRNCHVYFALLIID